ncbi:MAG: gliding motility-associated C-terminal domain-containing protein [Bacteroidetes bacterium]|nr:gliding motility-associated C-terminal domain-containing protein [Bacteroidota bacterium]
MSRKPSYVSLIILLSIISLINNVYSQGCDPSTPSLTVDLSSSPTASYTSPLISRNGKCCGATNPDRCLEFVITLHPDATAINFQISSGAVPPGALYYKINCGPPIAVGSPICLTGPGPHILTFCKPGSNANQFSITSYPRPHFGPNLDLNAGCNGLFTAYYYNESSITWESVSPGSSGAYNTYLSCTSSCDSTIYSGTPGLPPIIEYKVCGNDINGCFPDTICHLFSVKNIETPTVNIIQDTIFKCPTVTNVWVSAIVDTMNQQTNPVWSNGATTDSTLVGLGTHYITITDTSGCSTNIDSIVVANQTILPTVDAGNYQIVCEGDPVQLAGTTSNSQNPLWLGGSGTFSNNAILNPTYTPHPTEFNNGSTWLYLHVESLNDCDGAIDSIELVLVTYTGDFDYTTTDISCSGANDGSIDISMTSMNGAPFTFSLDGGTPGNTSSFSGLTPGAHSVRIVNANGCDTLIPFNILEPALLTATFTDIQNVSCNAGTDGSLTVTANGGTNPYTYSWAGYPTQTSTTLSGLTAGNYSLTVTDANGCVITINQTITEPATFPTVDAGTSSPTCYGNTIALSGDTTQSQNPTWFGGSGTFSTTNQLNTTYTPTNAEFIAGGVWLYFQVDALINGCPGAIDSVQLILRIFNGQPSVVTKNISCFGANDGTATFTMNNTADGPFTFSLDGGTPGNTSSFSGLTPGAHSVRIVNANGCDTLIPFNILEPAKLKIILVSVENVICHGDSTGRIEISHTGGTGSINIKWSNTIDNLLINDSLRIGTYTARLQDNNGCLDSISVNVSQPNYLTSSLIIDTIRCFGELAIVENNVQGGITPYTYVWNGVKGSNIQNFSEGTHVVKAIDKNNCTIIDTINIFAPQPLEMSISPDTTVCKGSNIAVTCQVLGGTAPYNYNWNVAPMNNSNNVQTMCDANRLIAITVMDSNNCSVDTSMNIYVYQNQLNDLSLTSNKIDVCVGDSIHLVYNYKGITPISSMKWTDCDTCSPSRWVKITQDSTFTVSGSNICSETIEKSIFINLIEVPEVNLDLSAMSACPNEELTISLDQNLEPNWVFEWRLNGMEVYQDRTFTTSFSNPGTYPVQLVLYHLSGCKYDLFLDDSIVVYPKPKADFEVDSYEKSYLDPSFQFTNLSTGGFFNAWDFGDGSKSKLINPQHTYTNFGNMLVQLLVTSANGCTDLIEKQLRITFEYALYVPNAFTPNQNNRNEFFKTQGIGISDEDFNLLIFNRWGEVVFDTKDKDQAWDGTYASKIVQDGTYTWKVQFKTLEGQRMIKTGFVLVMR